MTTDGVEPGRDRNGHDGCLICGALNPLSWRLSFEDADDGVVRASFRPQPELQGYAGLLHGGVIASLLDAAMTHWLFHRGVVAVTGDLHVRYVEPVPCGALLEIRAWATALVPPVFRLKAQVVLEGRAAVWAEGKFLRRKAMAEEEEKRQQSCVHRD